MIYRGKIPGYSGKPLWYDAPSGSGHDMFRRVYLLNLVRPMTRWRRIRAFIGWHELDTMRSGFRNKPVLNKGTIHFDGTQKMRMLPGPEDFLPTSAVVLIACLFALLAWATFD